MDSVLNSKAGRILSIVLLAQAGIFYGFSRPESVPNTRPLNDFHIQSPVWSTVEDMPLDKETVDVLQADDLLSRIYRDDHNGAVATLFVAYFKTQRTGKTPHSPKNCLPGSGWVPSESGFISIPIPGQSEPISVNRYVVARGDNQSVVLYWYQSHNRVVASEYAAKIYTVADAIRYNRSDTALVRVVVPVNAGHVDQATQIGQSFIQAFFEPLRHYLAE